MSWVGLPMIFIMKDGFGGFSLDKRLCGVRVVDATTGDPITFARSWKRNLVLLIPLVPLIIAFILLKGRRWGDRFANTKVVWLKYANHPLLTGRLACERCEYNLHGNTTGVCPKCGTPISSANQHRLTEPAAS